MEAHKDHRDKGSVLWFSERGSRDFGIEVRKGRRDDGLVISI